MLLPSTHVPVNNVEKSRKIAAIIAVVSSMLRFSVVIVCRIIDFILFAFIVVILFCCFVILLFWRCIYDHVAMYKQFEGKVNHGSDGVSDEITEDETETDN